MKKKTSIPEDIRIYYVRTPDRTIAGTVGIRLARDGKYDADGRPTLVDRAVVIASMKGSACKRAGRNIAVDRLQSLRSKDLPEFSALPSGKARKRFLSCEKAVELSAPLPMAAAARPPTDFECHIMTKEPANAASQPAA